MNEEGIDKYFLSRTIMVIGFGAGTTKIDEFI